MEEWVGKHWHRLVTRWADTSYPHAAVSLDAMERTLGMLFRAGGGDGGVRIARAGTQKNTLQRNFMQRIAGTRVRVVRSAISRDILALPPQIAVFPKRELNRDLYVWLAALAACFARTERGWIADNLAASILALERFPGLRRRLRNLLEAELAQRALHDSSHRGIGVAEQAVRATLRAQMVALQTADNAPFHLNSGFQPTPTIAPQDVAPVSCWIESREDESLVASDTSDDSARQSNARSNEPNIAQQDKTRRAARRVEDSSNRNGLVMFFRTESLLSWSEFVRVNRTADDEPPEDVSAVADDMDEIALARGDETLASRIKFDLDLPSAAADDIIVAQGDESLPEWDWKQHALIADRCRVQVLRPREDARCAMVDASPSVRLASKQVRRRLEALRNAPQWVRGLQQGDEIDLDAWVRFRIDALGKRTPTDTSPPIYAQRLRSERSLATLLLADLSMSTDAYATQTQRVIDVIRDSLVVFGDALHHIGDSFEMLGFSSVRRQLRIHELKRFSQMWQTESKRCVHAIKPGFYTRMGAAIRYGVRQLDARHEHMRLLLLLSDGKPNDLDHYEGRYGIEDTRHAIHEARLAGHVPFCVTIDREAHAYLPRLFGSQGFAIIHRPEHLTRALSQIYATLTART